MSADAAVLTVGSTAGPAPGSNVTWDVTAGMYDTTWVNNDHERTTEEVMRQLMGQVQPKAVPPPAAKRQDKLRRIRG